MAGSITPRLLAAGLSCALISLNVADAWAAGFFIREQSSTAQGNAFAGATAGADDISYMFFNPAGLTYHSESQALGMASYIRPYSRAKGANATTLFGNQIEGKSNSDDIGKDAVIPAFYAMWDADQTLAEGLRFGLGVNLPFGLVTDNNDDFVGRYHGTRSELKTINVNPVIAYRALEGLSLGAGLQIGYTETQLKNAIDFGSISTALALGGAPITPGTPGSLANDGEANLRGDDVAFGWNAGIMLDMWEGARVGLSYRSRIDYDIDGNVSFDLDEGGAGSQVSAVTGAFVRTGAEADFTSPTIVSLGFHDDINEEWSVMAEFAWTDWSEFNELRVEFDNAAQADSVTEEDWNDSVFVALGATYRPEAVQGLSLRLGLAYDESPIPTRTRTPRVPGEDRYWVSIGAGYKLNDWTEFTLSYTHIFMKDGDVELSTDDDPNNTFRGNLDASYDQHIDIVTFSGRIVF